MEVRSETIKVEVHAPISDAASDVLTPEALQFVGFLCNKFETRRRALLDARATISAQYDAGETPHFMSHFVNLENKSLLEPRSFVADDPQWKCAAVPEDVRDRRVEITGPVDRKMVINGLNSGANVYMADFEDSTSPTWSNLTEGQRNLRDAVRGTISFTNPKTGKIYKPNSKTAVLFVRPRGWHLDEAHVIVNGQVASGSLFDFGLYLYHNVYELIRRGTKPYFYLPKLEGYLEARLWNDVFIAAQKYLGISEGTIRATVLLETITAAFEMEEILYELRNHSLGLNCGRWDYLFSFIKKFKCHNDKIAPDRSHLTMQTPLMSAYVRRLIQICHKRGTFAMGGMSAAIPVKGDPEANTNAMENVKRDKLREVLAGHDGTWVAHPALVPVAKAVFDAHMPTPNQIDIPATSMEGNHNVTEDDLMQLPTVPVGEAITSKGLRKGIAIVLAYTEAWLRGVGCIPLNNAMEDAATAEISRAQIWQWRHHGVLTQDDGQIVNSERVSAIISAEVKRQCIAIGDKDIGSKWLLAGKLVQNMLTKETLDDFLTTICYPHILTTSYEVAGSRL